MRLNNPAEQWERYGQVDPYFGVISDDAYRSGNLTSEGREQFFESGVEWLDWLFECLDGAAPRSALDFGCGVGRVLIPLALRCETVTGVDVSPSMLVECKRVCDERGVDNVCLVDSLPGGQFDLVHSVIVLQHIPTEDGYRLIGELGRHVSIGGTAALQVSLRPGSLRARTFFWANANIPFVANGWNLLQRRPWSYPHMLMSTYSADRVRETLMSSGLTEFRTIHLPATNPTDFHGAVFIFRREE
jgi:SAM-dependent methyltransferase